MRSSITFCALLSTLSTIRAAPTPAPDEDLIDLINGQCDDIIIIWARGATESGNTGTVLGPPFFSAVERDEPGRVIVQGVNNYPADTARYIAGGSRTGARYMADMVPRAATQCPNAKIVLSGYSQGAQVTHLPADLIPTNLYARVAAIILFEDPYNGGSFPGSLNNNVRTFRAFGDLICEGLPIVLPAHSEYVVKVSEAAAYVSPRI
ncbi:cutinase [Choiromyces venosus 120613-1]|uniref:Cutinase n=1 Tax=Choiromyces venosus 120613-1 TaxID=1336337 RepID=A0A3N4JU66_9PEZI|nr:cutinase [Choiromyces venosus 120613-1]